jgi:hypothetical protein
MTLAELYALVPDVDCIPGCTDCCGVIPLPLRVEREAFGLHALEKTGSTPFSAQVPCPNSSVDEGCKIHDKRPFMCRLFGTVSGTHPRAVGAISQMCCPHGRQPKKPISPERAKQLTIWYFELAKKERH